MAELLLARHLPLLLAAAGCALAAVLLLVPAPRSRGIAPATVAGRARRLVGRLTALRRADRRLTEERLRQDVAAMLRQFAALLQSGRSPGQAWTDLQEQRRRGSTPHPLAAVCREAARAEAAGDGAAVGLRRAQAMLQDPASAPGTSSGGLRVLVEVLDRLCGAVALSEETGTALAELVRRIAAAAEDDAELHAAIRTAAAGPQTTQLILVLLPIAGIGLGQIMGADAIALLLDGGLGTACLVLGLALLAAGWWWGRGMIRAAVPHA